MHLPLKFKQISCFLIGILIQQYQVSALDVDAAAAYLGRAQKEDGFFLYEMQLVPTRLSKRDNIVRQAGAAFGLGQYVKVFPERKQAISVLKKAIQGLAKNSMPFESGRLVHKFQKNRPAGASALALLAALYHDMGTKSKTFTSEIQGWRDGLLALQKENGGIKRDPNTDEESPYYNGETWLALTEYLNYDPNNRAVKAAVEKLEKYLLKKHTDSPTVQIFHWAMQAAAKRYQQTKNPNLRDFMIHQIKWLFEKRYPKHRPHMNGCFVAEGLVPVYKTLDEDPLFAVHAEKVRQRVVDVMNDVADLQIKEGQQQLAFDAGVTLNVPYLPDYAGAFIAGKHRPTIRVDFTQHCLSAMLHYFDHL